MSQAVESSPAIDAFLTEHDSIRAMPESTLRILRMTRDPKCDTGQLLKLIEQDAALSARIMKAVNSSFYSLQAKITRLDHAVSFMGLKAIKEVAVSLSLRGLCKDATIGNHDVRELWDHSVGVAILSRELAVHSKTMEPEDLFLAGMLHDVGLLLAVQSEQEKAGALFQLADGGGTAFTRIEQNIFGFDHCELGERLSQKWNFPEYVTNVVRWHHEPDQAPEDFRQMCTHVFIADCACCQANVGFGLTCALEEITDEALETAQLSREVLAEVTAKLPLLLRLHLS